MLKSTSQAYEKIARSLHWASAILILLMFPLGLTMANMGFPKNLVNAPAKTREIKR